MNRAIPREAYPFIASTHGFTVSVVSFFLAEQSDPNVARYTWAYRIRIDNDGDICAQLISRHWIITDGQGRTEHVRGPGVVGDQPTLATGEHYEYTSGCPLSTPSGFMVGTYQMITENGETFEIDIPAFSLDSPHSGQTIN